MDKLRHAGRWLCTALLILALSLSAMPALAQEKKEEEKAEKSYVMPYMCVVLVIGLGLMIVLRPTLRDKDPARRDDDDEYEDV